MLLIDNNNRPTNTVYYLSAVAYDLLRRSSGQAGMNSTELYNKIADDVLERKVNFVFFTLALDFLFLLGKLEVDEKGRLHVH